MKRARVAYQGAIHNCTESDGQLNLDDGRTVSEAGVVWLPPVEPGAIFALGLNYADHAKELSFKPPKEPLIFLKGPGSLCGHRGTTRRPEGMTFMHYECELAVVVGKVAKNVSRANAYEYVSGYTVANDYATRDYLENYYRPNLRVKSRDWSTPLGPWLVDRDDIPNPMNLRLQTRVNGTITQSGSTGDMIVDIPGLIEYLSSILTLSPGDLILTGTPEGLTNVKRGDEVITEIEDVGSLANTII